MKVILPVLLCTLLTSVVNAQSAMVSEAGGETMRLVGTTALRTATVTDQRNAALEVLRSFQAAKLRVIAVELLDPVTNKAIVRVTVGDLK